MQKCNFSTCSFSLPSGLTPTSHTQCIKGGGEIVLFIYVLTRFVTRSVEAAVHSSKAKCVIGPSYTIPDKDREGAYKQVTAVPRYLTSCRRSSPTANLKTHITTWMNVDFLTTYLAAVLTALCTFVHNFNLNFFYSNAKS